MKQLISEKATTTIREEIALSGGNEVFFLGRTDETQVVVEVEALARGNRDTVAAIMISVSFGDVVIHNHPSGNLTPSQADLEIAALLGNQGVGFYIVDNSVGHCYQAVSPFVRKKLDYLSLAEIEAHFIADGVIAANLPGYEQRSEQTRMAFAVAEAFNGDRVTMIEAGTGTGKSLAYLLPAALWAKRNKERVVVSTNTINLQEQLTRKDIPFLQKHAGLQFRAVLIKGRGNYLCRRKLNSHREEPGLFPEEATELQAIIHWSDSTASGSKDDLSFIPKDELWEELCCEGDQCSRTKCRHYRKCFFYNSRREAAGADILVVNHALLMLDLALRQQTGFTSTAILPPFQRLIIDEAHHLEDAATSQLSSQVTRQGLLKLLGKLQHPRKAQRGLLPQLSALLSRDIPQEFDDLYQQISALLEEKLLQTLPLLAEQVTKDIDAIVLALSGHLHHAEGAKGEQKLRITPTVYASDFWGESQERITSLATSLGNYSSTLGKLLQMVATLPEKPLERMSGTLVDIRGLKGRLEGYIEALQHFTGHSEEVCRWFEVRRGGRGTVLRICSSPLEVAPTLKTVLFDQLASVILTSATLAVGDSFNYLARRTGISLLPKARVTELLLHSSFDYRKQAFAGVPADMPEPTGREFAAAASDFILKSLEISRGRAFLLFTSYDLLKKVHQRLAPGIEALGLHAWRQGDANRHQLLSNFKNTPGSVLFGTDSFWEGVDVQGEALELVIITRLPFRVPTEPILEARTEYISANGGDPFMEYTVPQAVIKFKQGFGRLIRSRMDRGGVLILDSRVLTRNYGRIFLKSLPDVEVAAAEGDEVLQRLRQFFST
jgi:ATP-dependent DNA helicase DinG